MFIPETAAIFFRKIRQLRLRINGSVSVYGMPLFTRANRKVILRTVINPVIPAGLTFSDGYGYLQKTDWIYYEKDLTSYNCFTVHVPGH